MNVFVPSAKNIHYNYDNYWNLRFRQITSYLFIRMCRNMESRNNIILYLISIFIEWIRASYPGEYVEHVASKHRQTVPRVALIFLHWALSPLRID